uniref:Protein kinase domain-containing protein n=1 Tax=Latimeria chalumnae TaxID=7897 RepID=H2ZV40_LATCH
VPAEKIQDRRFLASGRFGSVYRASHQDWGIPIALKVFHIPTSTSSSQRDELLREAEIMNKARFLYILRLFGVYEEEESFGAVHLGIVMELMENGSLDQLLQHVVPVPWALKFRLIHEVALGMNYLHGLNPPLLHLDLKPNNVLLDEYFHVRVRPTLPQLPRLRSVCVGGEDTPEPGGSIWGSPALERGGELKRSISSYGILIWSVVTGKQPYSVQVSLLLIPHRVSKGDRPDSSLLQNHKDVEKWEDVSSLMKRCWDNDPKKRPPF